MFCVIPIIQNPLYDYSSLSTAIAKAGMNQHHTLATIALQSNDEEAYTFAESLVDFYGKHVKITLEDRPTTTYERANRFFNAACKAYQKSGDPKFPMIYFDPTYRPTSQFWLDNLQANYFRSGAPEVFGNFVNGLPVGPIILNMHYVNTSTLREFLPANTHWRNFLAAEMNVKNAPEATESLTNLLKPTL
jgi:hypothetical protein